MLLNLAKRGAPAEREFPLFSSLFASTVMDIDVTRPASYSGTGTSIANLCASPADGSAASAYNMTLTGNVFSGSPDSPSAKLALDGSSYLTLTGAMTTFLNAIGRVAPDGQAFSFIYAGRTTAKVVNTNPQAFMGTSQLLDAGNGYAISNGTYAGATNKLTHQIRGNWQDIVSATSLSGCSDSTDKVIMMTFNPAGNGTCKFYVGDNTVQTVSHGFQITPAAPTYKLQICAAGNNGGALLAGSEFRAAAFFNAELSASDFNTAKAALNTRHGAIYA